MTAMKAGKIVSSFYTKDGRKVVLRTPKWEDLEKDETFYLVAEVDGKVVGTSELNRRAGAYEGHVYEKVGFVQTGRIPKKFFKDDEYIGEMIMTKVLE